MDAKICIDKRIWYLFLFSVPLILLAFFSAVINSTPLYQGSRAAGLAPTSIIKPTVSPTPSNNSVQSTCLTAVSKKVNGKNSIEISVQNTSRIDKTKNLKIYSYGKYEYDKKVTYLSLQQPPLNKTPLTRAESDFTKGIYTFIGIQGDRSAINTAGSMQQSIKTEEDFVIEEAMKLQCPSYIIPMELD